MSQHATPARSASAGFRNHPSLALRAGIALLILAHVASAAEPAFVLSAADGKLRRGTLTSLADGWQLRLADGQPLGPRDWVSLRRADKALPPVPEDAHVVLTSGDRIPFAPASLALSGDKLSFTCPTLDAGRPVRAGLSAVALVWKRAPDGVDDPSTFRRRLLEGKRRKDLVVLRNGDTVEGTLLRIEERRVEVDAQGKKVMIDPVQVAAVAPSTLLASNLKPKGLHALAVLADGARVTLRAASSDGKMLVGTTVLGAKLSVDLDRVIALDLGGGAAVYLSELTPAGYEHVPYLGISWPLAVNGSVAGRDLRLGGGACDRGLGMHSASRVRYAIPKTARFFEARVGLDDVSGRRGSVRVRVLVDGKEHDLGLSRDLRAGDVLDVRIDVAGGRELTLAVDFGQGGDVGDHVDWVDARLIE